jgi:hypothetical protein
MACALAFDVTGSARLCLFESHWQASAVVRGQPPLLSRSEHSMCCKVCADACSYDKVKHICCTLLKADCLLCVHRMACDCLQAVEAWWLHVVSARVCCRILCLSAGSTNAHPSSIAACGSAHHCQTHTSLSALVSACASCDCAGPLSGAIGWKWVLLSLP